MLLLLKHLSLSSVLFTQREFLFLCQARVIPSCIILSYFSLVLSVLFMLKGQVTVTKPFFFIQNPLLCFLRQEYFSDQWFG